MQPPYPQPPSDEQIVFPHSFPMTCQGLCAPSAPRLTAECMCRVTRCVCVCVNVVCSCAVMQGFECESVEHQPISSAKGSWENKLYSVLQVMYGHIKEHSFLCPSNHKSHVCLSIHRVAFHVFA